MTAMLVMPHIDAYERKLEFPVPPQPLQCMEDENWKQSRAAQMALQGALPSAAGIAQTEQKLQLARTGTI